MAPSAIHDVDNINHINVNHDTQFHTDGASMGPVLVRRALEQRVNSIDVDCCEAGEEDAFFVADLGEVYRQFLRWKRQLPRVKPHYGMFFFDREKKVKD